MEKELLKTLIVEYQGFVANIPLVERTMNLSDNFNYVFAGLRHTGKSYLMYQQIRHLLN